MIWAAFPHESLKGSSFRIGAASVPAAAGLPDTSQIYIRTPESVLLHAAPKMASASSNFL